MKDIESDFRVVAEALLAVHEEHTSIISAAVEGLKVDEEKCEAACREMVELSELVLGKEGHSHETLADFASIQDKASLATIRFHAALTMIKINGPPSLEKEIEARMAGKESGTSPVPAASSPWLTLGDKYGTDFTFAWMKWTAILYPFMAALFVSLNFLKGRAAADAILDGLIKPLAVCVIAYMCLWMFLIFGQMFLDWAEIKFGRWFRAHPSQRD